MCSCALQQLAGTACTVWATCSAGARPCNPHPNASPSTLATLAHHLPQALADQRPRVGGKFVRMPREGEPGSAVLFLVVGVLARFSMLSPATAASSQVKGLCIPLGSSIPRPTALLSPLLTAEAASTGANTVTTAGATSAEQMMAAAEREAAEIAAAAMAAAAAAAGASPAAAAAAGQAAAAAQRQVRPVGAACDCRALLLLEEAGCWGSDSCHTTRHGKRT